MSGYETKKTRFGITAIWNHRYLKSQLSNISRLIVSWVQKRVGVFCFRLQLQLSWSAIIFFAEAFFEFESECLAGFVVDYKVDGTVAYYKHFLKHS